MKKIMLLMAVVCLLLAGCRSSTEADTLATAASESTADTALTETAAVVKPLPDATMENLTDAILAVSLEEGDAYVDDSGIMQMNVKIYTYDKYDMVDISMLKVGDILATHAGELEVTALEQKPDGTVCINGGLDENGIDLVTDDDSVFYEMGFSDAKNWYEVGEATIRVSVDFAGYDHSDLDQGEVIIYPGDFLVGAVTDYNFTPHNTTIRVAEGQIVEMQRRYTP